MSRPLLIVVTYDVVSDARRTRLHALLKQYGIPVQKSAFEARLSDSERRTLLRRVAALLDPATDRLTIYPISSEQEREILHFGVARAEVDDARFYLV